MTRPTVSVTKRGGGNAVALMARLASLRKSDVLVGIPSEKTQRKDGEINNSSLLFLLSKGSPLRNLPARPVLEPSIEKAKALIAPELAAAAKAVTDQQPTQATVHLRRAGMIASNAAKRFFTDPDNNWAPNAPSTIAVKGSDKPNIDTGAMRRAITYVVRDGDRETPATEAPHTTGVVADLEEAVTLGGEAAESIL